MGVLSVAGVLAGAGAGTARADGYRYWSFWERQGQEWTYATQGPGTLRPTDGDVVGFRFSVSENSGEADTPRGPASFDAICEDTGRTPGTKRIALSVDFGTRADAPSGETPPAGRTVCARISEDGTAADALAAGLQPLRYNSESLLCAIAGYPKSGCGEQVSGDTGTGTDDAPSPDPGSGGTGTGGTGGSGPSAGLFGGIAAVAALGGAAVWQARRRRS